MLLSIMSILAMPYHISFDLMKKSWLTMTKPLEEAATLGEVLRIQFDKYYKTPDEIKQGEVALAMGIHQGTLSKVQNDKSPGTAQRWSSHQVEELLRGYHVIDKAIIQQIAYNFDLRLPKSYFAATLSDSSETTTLEATRRFEVQDTHITFRVYAGISAGDEEAEPIEGEAFSIPTGDLLGIDPVCVRVYRVNGDCMVSESARGLTMNICSGDKIAVDISQRMVNNNDVVAAYWRPGDKLVVKRYVEAGDHIVLKPTSPTHPPLIAQNNDDFEIIGKVVWRGGPYRA